MAKTARAVIAHGQDFDIREYPVPDPEPNTVLLRQELAGICGTDLHNWQNGIRGEMLLGHENVGIIESIGKGVTTDYLDNPISQGDRIVFAPGVKGGYGAYGFRQDADNPPHFSGGFADYIYLSIPNTCFFKNGRATGDQRAHRAVCSWCSRCNARWCPNWGHGSDTRIRCHRISALSRS